MRDVSIVYHKQGFTLLELLIAAALISVLAMFATQAYRSSASDVRVENAKAQALLLVNAAQRYYLEYPTATAFATGSGNKLSAFSEPSNTCNPSNSSPQNLINCGFLEYRQVAYEHKSSSSQQRSGTINMWFSSIMPSTADVTVCFQGKGRAVEDRIFCTKGDGFWNPS